MRVDKPELVRIVAKLTGWLAGAITAIYLINALTRRDASVLVNVAAEPPELSAGYVDDIHQTATYHFLELTSYGDRIGARLGILLFYGTVAWIAFALARHAHSAGSAGTNWLISRSRSATAFGVGLVALGVLPPLGVSLASLIVLEAAGTPDGLRAPAVTLTGAYVVAGVAYLLIVRHAARRDHRTTLTTDALGTSLP